jgi:hypothetical protein
MNELEDSLRRSYLFNGWPRDAQRNATAHDDALLYWQQRIEAHTVDRRCLTVSTSSIQRDMRHETSGEVPSSTMLDHLWKQLCGCDEQVENAPVIVAPIEKLT